MRSGQSGANILAIAYTPSYELVLKGHTELSHRSKTAIGSTAVHIIKAVPGLAEQPKLYRRKTHADMARQPYYHVTDSLCYEAHPDKPTTLQAHQDMPLREITMSDITSLTLRGEAVDDVFELADTTGAVGILLGSNEGGPAIRDLRYGIAVDGRTVRAGYSFNYMTPEERVNDDMLCHLVTTPSTLLVMRAHVEAIQTAGFVAEAVQRRLGINVPDFGRADVGEEWMGLFQQAEEELGDPAHPLGPSPLR